MSSLCKEPIWLGQVMSWVYKPVNYQAILLEHAQVIPCVGKCEPPNSLVWNYLVADSCLVWVCRFDDTFAMPERIDALILEATSLACPTDFQSLQVSTT